MTQPGKIIWQKTITRKQVQETRTTTYYVFGDNMARSGLGGQAASMRGEPNTIGIPTKWRPSTNPKAYFHDADLDFVGVQLAITSAFQMIESALVAGFNVVIPANGIGTGLAKLELTAPRIFNLIKSRIAELEAKFGTEPPAGAPK